ncbi:MAG: GTP 3',8-cyclase MoaA, partial [Rhodothermales bacterium]
VPLKINCVVMRGVNDDELLDFVEWTRDRLLEVRFIEFMPFDGNRWDREVLVPYGEMVSRIEREYELEAEEGHGGAVSKGYRVGGHRGRVGFITSMTSWFCEGCSRLRLTADGSLRVCLFGDSEVSLRDAMRGGASDEELQEVISGALGRKRARHAGMEVLATMANRPMITIGG